MTNVSRILFTGLIGLFMLSAGPVSAQQSLINVSGWNAYVHVPSSYSANPTKSYPTIIFFPGLGEVGTTASKVISNGPGAFISQGWNGNITVSGQTVEFIVISLQTATSYPPPSLIKSKIDEIKSQYRIDANNVILTGLSHGGWCSNMTAMAYPSLFKTVVEVQGVQPGDAYTGLASYPSRFANYAQAGGRLLGFEQAQDWRDMLNRVTTMNNAIAGSGIYVQTNFSGGGHCCWNSFYGGQGSQPSTFSLNSINQNMYEWMARRVLGAGSTPVNTPPVSNAGTDKIITLPTNSVTLAGSGSDANGTISAYAWAKVSGPSSGSIVNGTSTSTSVTGLVQGIYIFQLKVTDNNGATANDNVQVTVNPATAVNVAPVPNAGADKTLTLPTNSIVISGSGSDADGTISSYSWRKNAGGTAVLANTSSSSFSVSGLLQGIYDFELTVTDNKGATAKDVVRVTVNAAVITPPPTPGKIVKVNIYNGANTYSNTQWNNWKPASGTTSAAYKYTDGTSSTIKAVLSSNARFTDNGSTYGSGATPFPREVIRVASMSSTDRTLQITGLNPLKRYNLEFYASRAYSGSKTIFIVGTAKDTINTDYNVTDYAKFNSMAPNSSGIITISMKKVGWYQYLSGFSVAEVTTAGRIAFEDESAGEDAVAEMLDGVNISITAARDLNIVSTLFSGTGLLYIQDAAGRMTLVRKVSIGPGSAFRLPLATLKKGTYTIRLVTASGLVEEVLTL